MTNVKTRFLNGVAFAAIAAAIVGLTPPAHAGDEGTKIDALQQEIDDLNNQVADLKRSQNAEYTDIKADRDSDVKVTL